MWATSGTAGSVGQGLGGPLRSGESKPILIHLYFRAGIDTRK